MFDMLLNNAVLKFLCIGVLKFTKKLKPHINRQGRAPFSTIYFIEHIKFSKI
jgi:hypothetical protein